MDSAPVLPCYYSPGLPKFPQASIVATPFNDPIAESIEEYQAFLKAHGYSPLAKAAFGKHVTRK
jgi:hypothetical protein